jgi:hypothetical protein
VEKKLTGVHCVNRDSTRASTASDNRGMCTQSLTVGLVAVLRQVLAVLVSATQLRGLLQSRASWAVAWESRGLCCPRVALGWAGLRGCCLLRPFGCSLLLLLLLRAWPQRRARTGPAALLLLAQPLREPQQRQASHIRCPSWLLGGLPVHQLLSQVGQVGKAQQSQLRLL